MKNHLLMLLFSALLFVTGSAFAFTPPTPTGYVTDSTGKLSANQVAQLNRRLTDFQRATKNEVAVVMVPTLDGDNVEDATHQTFKTYGVGKAGLDNGVLLFIAVNDHKMRLQTGKGVEGEITDIQSNDILVSMRPFFRSGDFYGGVNTALDKIQGRLDNRFAQKADPGQGAQFNKPLPADSQQTPATATTTKSSCSVGGDVGNAAGWSFGLVALFIAAIAFARRYVRNSKIQEMKAIEAQVDADIAAEEAEKVRTFEAAKAETERRSVWLGKQRVIALIPPTDGSHKVSAAAPKVIATAPIPVRIDEVPVRLPQHDIASELAAQEVARQAEVKRAEARRAREAAERLEEQKAQARRERLAEEDRAESRRRQREDAEEAVAAIAAVEIASSIFSDDSSSSSDSGSSWGGSDSGGSDSGFGGGDSGGGGSSSDW